MMRDESGELLRRYSEEQSETAFRELVRQHSGVVYGTALRKLNGDRAAAQDVMQEVFTHLVRKAPVLGEVVLAGWLYRQTCRQASNQVRAESRRRKRELVAAETMSDSHPTGPPEAFSSSEMGEEIDRALLALPGTDRDALVLRYFESHDYKQVGTSQGITEEAARKRVSRALERLAAILRKNGVATTGGAASLGGTMSGMAATTTVPEAVISRVAAHALKAAPAGGLAALHPLLKSFLAGLLMTSAAAGTLAASRSREAASAPYPARSTTAMVKRGPATPAYLNPVPGYLSADDLIAEIKKQKDLPRHVLAGMRMDLLLESISLDKIPGFFALASSHLTRAEKDISYLPLLERWMKHEPEAAMSCIFNNRLARQLDPDGSSNVAMTIYERWLRHDPSAAEKWLAQEWANPQLDEKGFQTTLRIYMGMRVADWFIGKNQQDGAFQFIATIPREQDQADVLTGTVGGMPWSNSWRQIPAEQRLELYRRLLGFSDSRLGRKLAHGFWKNLSSEFPADLEALKSTLKPEENLDLRLIALELRLRDESQRSDPAGNFERLADAAMRTGLAAGIAREQVLQRMGESIVEATAGLPEVKIAVKWLDGHRDEVRLDDVLAAKAAVQPTSWSTTADGREEIPHGFELLLWGSRINDPERRRQVCRQTFERMLKESDRTLVATTLDSPDLPAGLVAELQIQLQETR